MTESLPPAPDVGSTPGECSLIAASRTRARILCLTGVMVLSGVGTEMAPHVLAYNLKRVMAIIGIGPLIEAMSAA